MDRLLYGIKDRAGLFYLDGPGMQDDCLVRDRLIDGLHPAIQDGVHLFRESRMSRVEVMDWELPGVAVVTIKRSPGMTRTTPTVFEGKDSA